MYRWARKRRENGERGSVLVELAMVVLPLMTIVLGMVEIGATWRDKSSAIQASRQGARVITTSSIAGSDTADKEALLAVLAGTPSGRSGAATVTVRKIIIFNADLAHPDAAAGSTEEDNWEDCDEIGEGVGIEDSDEPRQNSSSLGFTNICNVYLAGNDAPNNSLDQTEIRDNSNWGAGEWNTNFMNFSQDTASLTEVGVYVEIFRPYITSIFPGDGLIVSGYTIMRVEPEGL